MLLAERGTEDSLTGGSVAFAEDLDFKSSSLVKRARRVNNVADASINLEEQNNDDVERIARRRSRLLEPHPDVVNSPAHDAARRAAAAHFMPRAQVGEHYGNCIRLAAENKITYKNAFDLHLIDFMGEMIKKEDFTSFRMASSSLDASAKIYAGRVDAVHQETYKVLTGLGRSDSKSAKADDGADEPQAPADGDESIDDLGGASERKRKERKRAANSKNVIVTGLSKIRSRIKASDGDVDPLFQQQAAAYDDGGTVELQLNRLRTHSKFSELLQDSNTPLFRPRSEVDSLTCCTRLLEVPQPFDSHTLEASLCLAFDNFHFNKSDDDVSSQLAPLSPLFVSEAGDSGSVTPVPQASPPLMEIDDDDNPLPLPDADPDAVVVIGSSNAAVRFAEKNDVVAVPASDRSPTEAANGEGEMFVTSLKTMLTNHIENFGHVNDGVLGLWAGPEHWRKKAKRRRLDEFGNVAAPVEDVENVIEVGKSSRAKVTKIKRLNIDYAPALIDAGENQSKSGCLVRSDWSKQLEAYTKKSGKSPVLREQNRRQASERFNLLPPSITGARQNIYELCNRVVMTNLTDKKTDEARENATASAMAGGGIVVIITIIKSTTYLFLFQ
ncbi:unnamed protein product [Mesocestoides corti]|uniref:Condensin complex subunit 2 n=1 Tax=Mesocestoides corti TaxID=53468 RepID=A0A0R3UGI6_MESCO|nr:unnamed protein product [Mesocestoides corti]